jgi:DNA polymerase elongation subunit (family B)
MSDFYTSSIIRGDNILYRGYRDGKRTSARIPFRPKIYLLSQNRDAEWKTLDGRAVEEFYAGTIRETKEFIENHSDISNFEVFGNTDFQYQYLAEEFPNEVDYDPSLLQVCYLDIETECEDGFPSIENADQRINLITLRVPSKKEKNKFVTYSFCLHNKETILDKVAPDHVVFQFNHEFEMLEQFIQSWQHIMPDIITGWNVQFFDIPYLVHRINRILGDRTANKLSPWEVIKDRKVFVKNSNKEQIAYELLGIAILDYLDLYKKFTFVNRESYSLNHICSVELGEEKAKFDGFNSLQELYKKDFQKFLQYNYKDVHLVVNLETKLRLMELAIALAYSAKVNLTDVFSQVRTWDTIIFNYLNNKKIVVPMKKEQDKGDQFAGAYVKEPQIGMHEWIVSFDLNSLYPHLIMQYNISPEMKYPDRTKRSSIKIEHIIDPDSDEAKTQFIQLKDQQSFAKPLNLAISANGVFFYKNRQGFLPALMEKMYEERKMYKEKMIEVKKKLKEQSNSLSPEKKKELEYEISKYHNFQLVRKIQLNSAFGAIGNQYFRYFDIDLAEAITLSGQLSIKWIENKINKFLNEKLQTADIDYVIASDTDSLYISLEKLVKKYFKNQDDTQKIVQFINKVSNEMLQPFIDNAFNDLASTMNSYQQKMSMKRESIANKGIWTAKKKYMLNVSMGEENIYLTNPELKVMGVEMVKSSTPKIVRDALKESIHLIMNKGKKELRLFVNNFKQEFKSHLPEDIAFPRSCNNLVTYSDVVDIYKKSTPIAVRGSLLYNYYLTINKLTKKYPLIKDGDKIKYIYLKKPNIWGEHVVAFPSTLPNEFDLNDFIDYNTQYEKSFLDPLKLILDTIGWELEQQITLFDEIEEEV